MGPGNGAVMQQVVLQMWPHEVKDGSPPVDTDNDDGLWHDTSYFGSDDGLWHDASYFPSDDGLWHDGIYF